VIDRCSLGGFGLTKLGRHEPTISKREPALLLFGLSVFGPLTTFRDAGLEKVECIHSDILATIP
jgi:hypothetical protein